MSSPCLYCDRRDAGRQLAARLAGFAGRGDMLVLGLARGGLPVAAEVAYALDAPLDVLTIRKLGVPGQPELAMGAIASGGVRVLNREIVHRISDAEVVIEEVATAEQRELERRELEYRGDRQAMDVQGKTVIVVDDGLATGSTMRAAVRALRHQAPARIVVAVPVGAPDTCRMLRGEADDVVCPLSPSPLESVGQWYQDFSQTSDEEVSRLLALAQGPGTPTRG